MTKKSSTLHSVEALEQAGLLAEITPEMKRVSERFAVSVSPAMAKLIDPSNANDPIAAQFIPSTKESNISADELADPIGDEAHSPVKGIVHRYPDRLLLKLLHVCPVYCRFCFRREQVGPGGEALTGEELDQALAYIASNTKIWEVILTGGDPLMLSDRRLADVITRFNAMGHVKIIRIHTRVPVVEPERITPKLIAALRGRAPVYILLHANHARELTAEARVACARLVDAGFPMLSQSVLLRGVNDSVETLRDLMRAFVETRVKPHVINQLDLARGTSHFRVPLEEAQQLMRRLRGHISGLCQPTLILDIPGGFGKIPVSPVFAQQNEGEWIIEDFHGLSHDYAETSG